MGSHSITALIWYKQFFECTLSLDTDIMDITQFYTLFQMSRQVNTELHPYIQMMIKVYDTIDTGIVYLYENLDNISEDYFAVIANRINNLLQAYTDDASGWNKIDEHFWEKVKK